MSTDGLPSICSGLGCIEDDNSGKRIGYTKGKYCLDNLKDLLRFMRRDDPQTREVFKQVCKWNTVSSDIIPIIEYYQDDRNLVLNAVKVLVFLTMPLEASLPDTHEQLEYLWKLKSAIARSDVLAVAVSLLEKPLENLEMGALTDDDRKLVQLVFSLIRNILAVQDISINQKTEGSVNHLLSLRDSFLELLFRESVADLILVLAQHVGGYHCNLRQENLLLLEIFFYIFKGQDPELVAKARTSPTKVDKYATSCAESLQAIIKEEEEKKKRRQQSFSRHSKFYGTFMSFTMDGSKTLCKGPAPASRSMLLDSKVHRGASKRVVSGHKKLPTSNKDTLILLHDFLNQFLLGGYNVLMQSVLEDIEKEHHAVQNTDVIVFFQLAQFASSYQYFRILNKSPSEIDSAAATPACDGGEPLFEGGICGPVAETMKESMFALVISKWRYAVDTLKETNNYMFLGTAASLFKIMISMLDMVLKSVSEDTKEHQTACALLYKLFYDQTDQGLTHFLLNLVISFNTQKQAKSDLADLVEIIQQVLRLMETLQANGTLRVSKKTRKRRKKSSVRSVDKKKEHNGGQDDAIDSEIHVPVSDEHMTTDLLQKKNTHKSESDGQIESPGDDELAQEFAAERQDPVSKLSQHEGGPQLMEEGFLDADDKSESSGDEHIAMTDEVDFKITRLLTSLANTTTIRNMCWLLGSYKRNSANTNHSVICMLQRICDDLNLSPMLYQLSYLCIFCNILDEQELSPCKDYDHIVNFLTTLVRRMFRKMKSHPLLFVEVLLSKSRGDCHFINLESMKQEVGDMGREVRNWEHNSKNEDASLPQAMRSSWSMADALGDDECDVIVSDGLDGTDHEDENLTEEDCRRKRKLSFDKKPEDNAKGRVEILTEEGGKRKRKLSFDQEPEERRKGLSLKIKESSPKLFRHTGRLSASDDEKIRSLFEQFRDQKKCSQMIAESLDPDGKIKAAQVSRRLKKLGLCSSKRRNTRNLTVETSHDDSTEEDSDNLTLSILKRRKSKTNTKETGKAGTASRQLHVEGRDPESGIVQGFMESEVEAAGDKSDVGSDLANISASPEHKALSADNTREDEPQSHGSELNQQSYNELEDSDVDVTESTPLESTTARRRLRMIIDPEDDE